MRNQRIQGMRERLVELLIQAIEHGNNGETITKEIRQQMADLMAEKAGRRNQA